MSSLFTGIFPIPPQRPAPPMLNPKNNAGSLLAPNQCTNATSHIAMLSQKHHDLASIPWPLPTTNPLDGLENDKKLESQVERIDYLLQDARWDTSHPKWSHISEALRLSCVRGGYPIRMPEEAGQEDRDEEYYFSSKARTKSRSRAHSPPLEITEAKINNEMYLPISEGEHFELRKVRRERAINLRSPHKFQPEKVTDWMAGVLPPSNSQMQPPPLTSELLESPFIVSLKKKRREDDTQRKEKEKQDITDKETDQARQKSANHDALPVPKALRKVKNGPKDSRMLSQEKLAFPVTKQSSLGSLASGKVRAKTIADISSSSFEPPSSFPNLPQSTPNPLQTLAHPRRASPPPIQRVEAPLQIISEPVPFPSTQEPQLFATPVPLQRKTPERQGTDLSSQSIPGLLNGRIALPNDALTLQRSPDMGQRLDDVQMLPPSSGGGPGPVTPPRSRSPASESRMELQNRKILPLPQAPTTPTRGKRLPLLADLLKNSPVHSPKRLLAPVHISNVNVPDSLPILEVEQPAPSPADREHGEFFTDSEPGPLNPPSNPESKANPSEIILAAKTPSPPPSLIKRSFRDLTMSAPSPMEYTTFIPQYTSTAPSSKPSEPAQSWGFGHAPTGSAGFVGAPYDDIENGVGMAIDVEEAARRAGELLANDVDYVKRFEMNEWVNED